MADSSPSPAEVALNRVVVDHDVALVIGPVFPHEVVGFSGGNKYFFPGIAGQQIIDLTHWVGALITSAQIIGALGDHPGPGADQRGGCDDPQPTGVRCASSPSRAATTCTPLLRRSGGAWAASALISAETHVKYLDAPVKRVVSLIPEKYEDIWTAAKGFYKLEPVVADGGEVILYAPHVKEISLRAHQEIYDIGYHCRDYFVKQWDKFSGIHWGVLAHSTHLRGAGTYDEVEGEKCRVNVTLVTSIPTGRRCCGANLGCIAPGGLRPRSLRSRPRHHGGAQRRRDPLPPALTVDPRTFSWVGMTKASPPPCLAPLMIASTLLTAVMPICRVGAATVVSVGSTSCEVRMSSKPMMLTCSGTFRPDVINACMTPIAIRSL